MPHFHHSLRIEAPIDQVYATARDPETWSTWFVGVTGPERLTGSGEVGTVADFEFLLAGMRFPVTVKVVEDKLLPEGATWVGKVSGPFEGEQRWNYRPHGGETAVTLEVEYSVPGSVFGRLADKVFIERMMERNFQHSAENLKMICEGSNP